METITKKDANGVSKTRTIEIRCPASCGCGPRRRLLATLIDFPESVFGSGAVLQVVCPSRKSRLLRIVL